MKEDRMKVEQAVEHVWAKVLVRFIGPVLLFIVTGMTGWTLMTVLTVDKYVADLRRVNYLIFFRLNDLDGKGFPPPMNYSTNKPLLPELPSLKNELRTVMEKDYENKSTPTR